MCLWQKCGQLLRLELEPAAHSALGVGRGLAALGGAGGISGHSVCKTVWQVLPTVFEQVRLQPRRVEFQSIRQIKFVQIEPSGDP